MWRRENLSLSTEKPDFTCLTQADEISSQHRGELQALQDGSVSFLWMLFALQGAADRPALVGEMQGRSSAWWKWLPRGKRQRKKWPDEVMGDLTCFQKCSRIRLQETTGYGCTWFHVP
jgi:hypothetical protein